MTTTQAPQQEEEHIEEALLRAQRDERDPVLELVRRNALTGLMALMPRFKNDYHFCLKMLEYETAAAAPATFEFRSVGAALDAMDYHGGPRIGEVDYWNEWRVNGGARWLAHEWTRGLNDLLLRIRSIRERTGVVVERRGGGERVQLPETGFEDLEAFLLRFLGLVLRIASRDDDVYTAAFWRDYDAFWRDCDAQHPAGCWPFWHLWFAFAQSQVRLTRLPPLPPQEANAIAEEALRRLKGAAQALFAEDPAVCFQYVQALRRDRPDLATSPPFLLAVALL